MGQRRVDNRLAGRRSHSARHGLQPLSRGIASRRLQGAQSADIDRVHRFLVQAEVAILDAPAEYPQYGDGYYAMFFADPDGMAHFPWGDWKTTQLTGRDQRARYSRS